MENTPFLSVNRNTRPLLEEVTAARYSVDELAELMKEARVSDEAPAVVDTPPLAVMDDVPATDANTILEYNKDDIARLGIGTILDGILPVSGINLTNLLATMSCTRILAELPILNIPIRTPKFLIFASGMKWTVNYNSFDILKAYISIVSLLRANPLVATRAHIAEFCYNHIVKRVGYLPGEAAAIFASFCRFSDNEDHTPFLRASQDAKTLPDVERVFQYFNKICVADIQKLVDGLGMGVPLQKMAEDIIDNEMTESKRLVLEKFAEGIKRRDDYSGGDRLEYHQFLNVQLTIDLINTYEHCIFDILAHCIPNSTAYREYADSHSRQAGPSGGFEQDMMASVVNFDKIFTSAHLEELIFEQRKNYALLRKACMEDACDFDLWIMKPRMTRVELYGSQEEYEDLLFYFKKYTDINRGYFLLVNDIDHEDAVLNLDKKLWREYVISGEPAVADLPVVENAYMALDVTDLGPFKTEGMWSSGMNASITIPTKQNSPRQDDVLFMLFYVQNAPILVNPCPINIARARKPFDTAKCYYCKSQLLAWDYIGDNNVTWSGGLYHYISDHDACISHEFYSWLAKQFHAVKEYCASHSK